MGKLAKRFDPGPRYIDYGPFVMKAEGLFHRSRAMPGSEGSGGTPDGIRVCSAFEVLGGEPDPPWLRLGKMDRVYGWGRRQSQVALAQRGNCRGIPQSSARRRPTRLTIRTRRAWPTSLLVNLAGVKTKRRVTIINRTGWHEIGGRLYFVLPDETFGPVGKETVILDANAVGPYEVQGSLREWRDGIGRMAAGHDLMILVISAGLASMLLKLAKQEGGGMNLYAASSTGKTTLIQVGSSLRGRERSRADMSAVGALRPTGSRRRPPRRTIRCSFLTELGVLQVQAASAAIYGLANGGGKLRNRPM